MRSTQRALVVLSLGCLCACLAVTSSCGGGAQDRPVITATFPSQGQALPSGLRSIRITYDGPVEILSIDQLTVFSGGVRIPMWVASDPVDPASIIATPVDGTGLSPGVVSVLLEPGLVINEKEHYRLNDYSFTFTLGIKDTLFLGVPTPAAVVEAEAETFAFVASTRTPGLRPPVGLAGSAIATDTRIWVQLGSGGGEGDALAWFAPGDAAMTALRLTHTLPGDLVATAPAIALAPGGRTLFAAYRDTAADQVRLCRIDVATATETGSLLLSPSAPAFPGTTRPLGLSVTPDGGVIDVACATGAGDELVSVDAHAMVEDDIGPGPGTDGLPLPAGAGPTWSLSQTVLIAPAEPLTAVISEVDTWDGTITDVVSSTVGSSTSLLVTTLGSWTLASLAGYAGDEAVVARALTDLATTLPIEVRSLTTGSNPAATTAHALALHPFVPRVYTLLDNDAVALLAISPTEVVQEDFDDTTPEIDAADITAAAVGATSMTFLPPAVLP